ncbi:MAG: glucosamine-6-phosphate deaminase [Candidatus Pacearchaeota archaeon]
MELYVLNDEEEICKRASEIIFGDIRRNPRIILGFATGSTMIPLYKRLVEISKKENISFSEVHTFNLDEYVGISANNKNSYRFYMEKNFFRKVHIPKENIHFLNGEAKSLINECSRYEKEIKKLGGIDIQILGIGTNCHIGFNEPGSSFKSRTRKVKLSRETRKANSKFFSSFNKVPKYALTMGISTIMNSKKIILLAFGKDKSEAVKKTLTEEISEKFPSTILRRHKNSIVIVDRNAASKLKWKIK